MSGSSANLMEGQTASPHSDILSGMKPSANDHQDLWQLKQHVAGGKTIKVAEFTKANFGQSVISNRFFQDFDGDGVISHADYLLAWDWVVGGSSKQSAPVEEKLPELVVDDLSSVKSQVANERTLPSNWVKPSPVIKKKTNNLVQRSSLKKRPGVSAKHTLLPKPVKKKRELNYVKIFARLLAGHMKILSRDYYELWQLKQYLQNGGEILVHDLIKEHYGQEVLENKYFCDFDLDGVIGYDDYLIAWNWILQGKPTDIREFVRDRGAAPKAKRLPYQYMQDEFQSTGLPPDNRVPTTTDDEAIISADWDSDGEIDELESKILTKYILAKPKTPEEYNRLSDKYPPVKRLPNNLTAKYMPSDADDIDWNDLLVFNEWLRQGKPKNMTEFNNNSVEGMDWSGDASTSAWLLIEGGVYVPIVLGEPFPPVRAMYLVVEQDAGDILRARITHSDPNIEYPTDKITGPGLGYVTGVPSHRAYPLQNAFDDRDPIPFWADGESGSNIGGWVTWQRYLPYVYIQYQFANYQKQKVTQYVLKATFVSPPLQWVLQGANAEDLFQGDGSTGETGWKTIDTVIPEYDYPIGELMSGLGKGYMTGSPADAFDANFAFDGSNQTRWRGLQSSTTPVYLQFQFFNGDRKRITKYTVTSWSRNTDKSSPKAWKLQGTNWQQLFSSGAWDDLDNVTEQTEWGPNEERTFDVDFPGMYEYYRILVTEVTAPGPNVQISQFRLFSQGEGDPEVRDWPRGTSRTFVVDDPGEYEYYRFIFSDVHDPGEEYIGLHEIEFYGMKANNALKRIGTLEDGRHYYGLPWQLMTNIHLDGLLPPEPYEIMGLHSKTMPETYVGAENL